MKIFDYMERYDYEQLVFCQDENSGLKAIIAIHDTTLGPALGGTRMWTYDSEEDAIEDALRLARGMTYKAAGAGLNLGGGKAVIIGDPRKDKTEEMFRAFGRYIQGLNGRYITAEDVGTTVADMDTIHMETDYVTGVSPAFGSSGNPSPVTAYGVYRGMKAAVKAAFGNDDLGGKTIAVQGVGNVAYNLCRHLHEEGATLIVTDINKDNVQRAVDEFGAKAVDPDDIYNQNCDIFSPCALGAIINDSTIPQIKAKVIAGAANNQLREERHGDIIQEMGIVYAPDYIINAGGLINVADELQGYNRDRAMKKVETIYDNIQKVIEISKRDHIPTYKAADRMCEERIASMQRSRSMFLQDGKHELSRIHHK
ncbi:branched-chain amino acid dehydrogenase [Aneurinibacillus aneurinilyticus]|jgi:leucine dehydrogenase|uniref:Leucine dehydrogenase n=2 Tax=Aneurinibacillus aneurinilyticus TaxID=1391 RepID=A0A848CHQ7_ANEAE|nr:branched-chain amino acid dehydrogenase [Aneurinibacillus aneurinilyticus]ERI05915.1 leucine dehydrogenase [Aneurinibacillus aneurinilyticus ATCC 12856]MCI1692668.1 branched-chain amino acid dehydrogenase [Aneurinibacillus aneurinilyticus]MED0672743.1 branched-chain amino acid dehydrogenase [Aneurinibacillus aneurinilyticus]MED0708570.1 branched-chain amino acid dehydrogenase [Aneurinibacillus aneurinilyticus]MED0721730.1 branched-chain amino acid dehydrogenase [Aneurinibacillus aneurinilyt